MYALLHPARGSTSQESAADATVNCPSTAASLEGRLMNHEQKCWYHAQVYIATTCFCCISELTQSAPRTVLSRGKGMLMSETLPTCCAAAPLSSPENTIKIAHFDPILPSTYIGWNACHCRESYKIEFQISFTASSIKTRNLTI